MQKRPLHVLFITSTFPRSENDVLANWIGQLATKLKEKGILVEVMVPSFKGERQTDYMGIRVHRFRYAPAFLELLTQDQGAPFKIRSNPLFLFLVPLYLVFGCMYILRIFSKTSYDVVDVHWPFPNGLLGMLAKKLKSKLKLVLTFHGAEFALARQVPFGIKILRFIVNQADSIRANSTFTKKMLQDVMPVKVEVIPFGSTISVDKNKENSKNNQLKQSEKKRILFVGRLIERKGLVYLIDAVKEVVKHIDTNLDIVGSGPLVWELNHKIKLNGLEDIVRIHTHVGSEELKRYYQNCDVFILPAIIDQWGDTEGQGVVLLEALNFKKPVIASDVGGIIDIVKDGKTGVLIPEKDSQRLAEAVKKILTDRNLAKQLGEAGYHHAKDNFGWEKIIEKTIETYR